MTQSSMPVQFGVLERDEDGRETSRLWTPPSKAKARDANVVYEVSDAQAKEARASFDAVLQGKICRNCRHFLNDPNDAEAQRAKQLAWQSLVLDEGFANHHFDVNAYGVCIAHFEDSRAAFSTVDATCDDFKPRGGLVSFLGKLRCR